MSVSTECLVMFGYEAKLEDELNLRVGDIITRVYRMEGGWWSGKLGNKEGVFPENYVRVLHGPDFKSGPQFLVSYPYKPVREDELALVAGQVVEKVGELEQGWWRGMVGGKLGVFPSSFVKGPLSDLDLVRPPVLPPSSQDSPPVTLARSFTHRLVVGSSPVVFRRNSSRVKSIHASLDQNMSVPISANLFDPEDEPLGPMFGSLSSQLEQDWSTASLSSCSNNKPGLFDRIRHSFSGKSILPRFLSGRLSSGSLFETRSTCSPMMTRRNSFAAFFKRSPSAASSKQDLKETTKLNRNSRSWDMAVGLPGLKPLESTPVLKLEGDFRKVSLSSDIKRSGRDPEQSLSWVWQEVGSKTSEWTTPTSSRRPFISSGDSGVDGCETKYDEPEELFGPVEITDEVFEDMFNNSKYSPNVPIASTFDFSEALEENLKSEGKGIPFKIRTSFTSIDLISKKALRRNSTPTNPFVSWKPNTSVHKLDKVQVTEI